MKNKITLEIISALIILLWVYAAVSKLIDYSTFKVQLGKSPLLTQFTGFVAIAIPIIELLISGALIVPKYRMVGLYGSLFMLVMFTAYLIVILNFSYYIPCSCGGILSGLSWNTHIVFNLAFAALAVIGIVIITKSRKQYAVEEAMLYK